MSQSNEHKQAAILLTCGFSGVELTETLKELLDAGIGGVILFGRNVESAAQVAELIFSIKSYAGRPLFVGLDQEGGVVQRLKEGFARVPPMRLVGDLGDEELAQRVGGVLGQELRAVGVDVNYAPVIDVDTNPDNPVIGNRSFGRDAALVARLGVALGRGLESAGVASCAKHFPGHGDTHQDSHIALPRLGHSLSRLEEVELLPFYAWAKAGLASVMSAHVIFDELDSEYPATMSPALLDEILRRKIRYEGLVFSDDMEMKAIVDHYGIEEAAIRGVNAGIDSFLCCHSADVAMQFVESIGRGLREGSVVQDRFSDACKRVTSFTERWARPAEKAVLTGLNSASSQALMKEFKVQPVAQVEGESVTASSDSLEENDPTVVIQSILEAEAQTKK